MASGNLTVAQKTLLQVVERRFQNSGAQKTSLDLLNAFKAMAKPVIIDVYDKAGKPAGVKIIAVKNLKTLENELKMRSGPLASQELEEQLKGRALHGLIEKIQSIHAVESG